MRSLKGTPAALIGTAFASAGLFCLCRRFDSTDTLRLSSALDGLPAIHTAIVFSALLLGFIFTPALVRGRQYRFAWLYSALCLCVAGSLLAPLAHTLGWGSAAFWARLQHIFSCGVPVLALALQCRSTRLPRGVSRAAILCGALLCAACAVLPLTLPARALHLCCLPISIFILVSGVCAVLRSTVRAVPLMAGLGGYAVVLLLNVLLPHTEPAAAQLAGAVLFFAACIQAAWDSGGIRRTYAALQDQLRAAQRLLDMQVSREGFLSGKIHDMEVTQHDQRHHLAVLRTLWEACDYEQLGDYLAAYEEGRRRAGALTICRNPVADAVLRHYMELAAAEDISLTVDADIPEKLSLTDVELCAVLGNLLENAVEACRQLPPGDRRIALSGKRNNGMLVLSLCNSYPVRKDTTGAGFSSRKRGGAAQGLGLDSVRRVARRHGGSAEFEADSARGEFRSLFQAGVLPPEPAPQAGREPAEQL